MLWHAALTGTVVPAAHMAVEAHAGARQQGRQLEPVQR